MFHCATGLGCQFPLMRPVVVLLVLASLSVPFVPSLQAADTATALAWPTITRENKPWTRWWWPGSGVDKASLTAQLEKFAAAGLGGKNKFQELHN